MTTRRLFREAALRRHLERRAEVHLPPLVAPRVILLSWGLLALVSALIVVGLCSPLPDGGPGEASAAARHGECRPRRWISLLPIVGRLAGGAGDGCRGGADGAE